MMANITFLSFLLFSMCYSIHVAVNTWLNCSFFTLIYSKCVTETSVLFQIHCAQINFQYYNIVFKNMPSAFSIGLHACFKSCTPLVSGYVSDAFSIMCKVQTFRRCCCVLSLLYGCCRKKNYTNVKMTSAALRKK